MRHGSRSSSLYILYMQRLMPACSTSPLIMAPLDPTPIPLDPTPGVFAIIPLWMAPRDPIANTPYHTPGAPVIHGPARWTGKAAARAQWRCVRSGSVCGHLGCSGRLGRCLCCCCGRSLRVTPIGIHLAVLLAALLPPPLAAHLGSLLAPSFSERLGAGAALTRRAGGCG